MREVADARAEEKHDIRLATGPAKRGQAVEVLGHDPAYADRSGESTLKRGGEVRNRLLANVDRDILETEASVQQPSQEDLRLPAVAGAEFDDAERAREDRSGDLRGVGLDDFRFAAREVVLFQFGDSLKEPVAFGVVKVHRRQGLRTPREPLKTSRANAPAA